MELKAKTKLIQLYVGASDDGVYGNQTADKIMEKLGISTASESPIQQQPAGPSSMVQGNAKGIKNIFLHCSATREGQDITADTIRGWHKNQGWNDIGYHYVIRLDGTVERGRNENVAGAHVSGFNTGSIGIVYVGGLDANGKSKDTRTPAQKAAMASLVRALTHAYPGATVLGHRDASPDKNKDGKITPNEWIKDCPCFDAKEWWDSVK